MFIDLGEALADGFQTVGGCCFAGVHCHYLGQIRRLEPVVALDRRFPGHLSWKD
jgi:hypothetical protein